MVHKERASPRPRGRPRSFDEAEVLDRARAVFWDLGYSATSLDDIAAATGLNRPSLYAAFGDKHALYMAALARSQREATRALAGGLASEGPLRAVLSAIFDGASGIYRAGTAGQRGCFLIGTAVTQAVDDPEARALLSAFIADTDRLFRERFERDAEQLAPGLEPAAAATLATGTLHTLAIRARTGAGADELGAVALATVAAISGDGLAVKADAAA